MHDRRAILESALSRGMGETTNASIRQEFERRVRTGEFREVAHNGAGPRFTTTGMIRMEREIIARMQEGLGMTPVIRCLFRHMCGSEQKTGTRN